MVNGGVVDREKVLATVTNGIKENGYCLEREPYNCPSIKYGDCNIEISSLTELTAIKEICRAEGFHIKTAYHPASGLAYGYEVSL